MPFAVKLYDDAIREYAWALEHRPDYAEKINTLVAAIAADPFKGIGKPEPLKHGLQGFWSRRVTKKHRLVYRVKGDKVSVYRCLEHYDG